MNNIYEPAMKDMVSMTAQIIELSAKTLNRLCLDGLTND